MQEEEQMKSLFEKAQIIRVFPDRIVLVHNSREPQTLSIFKGEYKYFKRIVEEGKNHLFGNKLEIH